VTGCRGANRPPAGHRKEMQKCQSPGETCGICPGRRSRQPVTGAMWGGGGSSSRRAGRRVRCRTPTGASSRRHSPTIADHRILSAPCEPFTTFCNCGSMSPAGATAAYVIDGLAQLRRTIAPERCRQAPPGQFFRATGAQPLQLGLMAATFAQLGRTIMGNCAAVARCGQLDVRLCCAMGNTGR